jgi:hypothetical protein
MALYVDTGYVDDDYVEGSEEGSGETLSGFILSEDGSKILQEDGISAVLIEDGAATFHQVVTVAGTSISVSTALPTEYTADGYQALTYTDIGELSDVGTGYGRAYRIVSHARVSSGQTLRKKGGYEFPPVDLTMAWDESDAGQEILMAASLDYSILSFRITKQNGERRYFTAQVSKMVENFGTVDDIVAGAATLLRQTDIVRA